MKKKLVVPIVAILALFVFSLGVFAENMSWWPSTLSLGIGSSVNGATRKYYAGRNKIRIAVSQLVTDQTHKEVRLATTYSEEASNYCELIGSVIFKTTHQTGFEKDWGLLQNGNRFYTFSTKINGTSYAGLISKEVIMYSEYVPNYSHY